jgi:large subunit ribosomal protein L3
MIGRKVGMTQVFDENGNMVPVTVVKAGPCQILEVKTPEKDGYSALKIGFEEKIKNVNKPEKGYFEAIGKASNKTITPKRTVKEFRVADTSSFNMGDVLNVDLFEEGEKVDIAGTSKGKGFQGVVKRYGFAGGPASHGSQFHRRVGAIGAHTFPARVWKGQKMPGQTGNRNTTVRNLKIFKVDADNGLILIKGAIPGPSKGMVVIRKKK